MPDDLVFRAIGQNRGPERDMPPGYRDYLESETWRDIRGAAIESAGHVCEACSSKQSLEVHHLTYERFGGYEIPSDLLVVCPTCHVIADAIRKDRDPLYADWYQSLFEDKCWPHRRSDHSSASYARLTIPYYVHYLISNDLYAERVGALR